MNPRSDVSQPREGITIISADGHCGAELLDYKPYLEKRHHDEFDAWASTYQDAWAEIDQDRPLDDRIGAASFASTLNWDSTSRLEFIESQGIAAEVLFPNTSPPFFPSGSISAPGPTSRSEFELRSAGLRAHNRWLVDFCNDVPGRRAGFAQIFLDDIDAAVAEVRWAREAGLMGVLLPSDHTSKMVNLFYPRYDSLWATCAELDLPIHRHGIQSNESVAEGGPASQWIASLEMPFYGFRAISHLICAGVFERFPRLKFVATEMPNAAEIPAHLLKLDGMFELGVDGMRRPLLAKANMTKKPSEYFASNCYVGGPLDLRVARDAGTPNLMFGADVPHSEGTAPHTMEALRRTMSDLPESEIRELTSITPAQVYGFDVDMLRKVADRIGPTIEEITRPIPQEEWPKFPEQTRCRFFSTAADPRFQAIAAGRKI